MTVIVKKCIFWDVTQCSLLDYKSFAKTPVTSTIRHGLSPQTFVPFIIILFGGPFLGLSSLVQTSNAGGICY
jgi:hypothetical protein